MCSHFPSGTKNSQRACLLSTLVVNMSAQRLPLHRNHIFSIHYSRSLGLTTQTLPYTRPLLPLRLRVLRLRDRNHRHTGRCTWPVPRSRFLQRRRGRARTARMDARGIRPVDLLPRVCWGHVSAGRLTFPLARPHEFALRASQSRCIKPPTSSPPFALPPPSSTPTFSHRPCRPISSVVRSEERPSFLS